jgi:hypothetical protein
MPRVSDYITQKKESLHREVNLRETFLLSMSPHIGSSELYLLLRRRASQG